MKRPPVLLSLIPLVCLCILIAISISLFGDGALNGASQIVLLVCSAIAVTLALPGRYVTFRQFEQAITDKVASVAVALVILLLIGALAGSWMISGIVPCMIYYGMQILHPSFFLVASCIISGIVSVMTGSSWTTIATIGVALMGIGEALGISAGWVGGSIVAGAYFGDKMSPLSDTTIMASSVCGVPLFKHIRFLMGTTVPSLGIALLVYLVVGLVFGAQGESNVAVISEGLQRTFHISPWLLVVPVATGIMIARKMPTLAILFLAVVMGTATALIAQPELVYQIGGEHSLRGLVSGTMTMIYGSTALQTGVPMLDDLVSTSGMSGMVSTIWLIICAMIFGASLTATGMLESLVLFILRIPKRPSGMVATTVVTGFVLNAITCDQYISIIISSSMFKDAYQKMGLDVRLLSRSIEDSATVTSPLIPWSTCGMTQAHVLGVSTFAYAPYALFNYLCPLLSIAVANFAVKRMQGYSNDNV